MFRVMAFAVGAAAFALAHAAIVAGWRTVFAASGDYAPWFLNSGRAVAFTAACLFITSFVYLRVAPLRRTRWLAIASSLAAGAIAAMVIALTILGPGTILPIAIAIGGLVAFAACAAGGYLAARL